MSFTNLHSHLPIGIFDSGIGGLTVANAIQRHLPKEQIIYFGDTAHLPYGDKEPYSIRHYSTEISRFLLEQGCKIIILACNTASSIAYKQVQRIVKDKALVLNVIDPVVDEIANSTASQKVGVIGTKGTIKSGVYRKKLTACRPELKVVSMATPLLAPMIEEGFINDKISQTVLESYLSHKKLQKIDTMILACTHYPLIKEQVADYFQQGVQVIDSAEIVGLKVKQLLEENNLVNTLSREPHQFFVSDYTSSFEQSARHFFKEKIKLEKGSIWS